MKRFIITITLGVLSVYGFPASAQTVQDGRDMRQLIDSLSNPMTADGSEVMRFEISRIDAGEMNEDSGPSEYLFPWTNEGETPLAVTFVQTTCGCAAPSYDRTPVQPGKSGSLKITYYPKGRPGGFVRRIFVYTSLSESRPTAVLELSGKVLPSVMPTDDYPVAMGGLLLKRSVVNFAGDTRQTERIECLNASDKLMEITVDPKTLPDWILVEPVKLDPGEIADLILRFDPSKAGRLPKTVPVFLKGIPLPPTKCMIEIKFE